MQLFQPDFIEQDGKRYWREDLVTVNAKAGKGDFEAFWSAYPKRGGKRLGKEDARKVYVITLRAVPHETLMAAVRDYAASCGEFAVDAHRWLKHKRWVDHIGQDESASPEKFNVWLAEQINGDAYLPQTLVTSARLGTLISAGLVTYERARARGLV